MSGESLWLGKPVANTDINMLKTIYKKHVDQTKIDLLSSNTVHRAACVLLDKLKEHDDRWCKLTSEHENLN